jgi:hypothetical protein
MMLPSGTFLFLAAAAAAFALAYWTIRIRSRRSQLDSDWLLTFSSDRYAILGRILAAEDYEWILSKAGGQPMCDALRAHRRRAFRKYLKELSSDFNRLQRLGRMMATYSNRDEAELTRFLLLQWIQFHYRLALVRWHLEWSARRSGNIDVQKLLTLVERTHSHVFWIAVGDHRSGVHAA